MAWEYTLRQVNLFVQIAAERRKAESEAMNG